MTTPTHTAVGYFLSQAFIQSGIIPAQVANQAMSIGMIAANLPDIDCVAFWRIWHHRARSPFHKPLLWALVLVPILGYLRFAHAPLLYGYALLTSLGILSHFICDSIDYSTGITWLWPFTNKYFHFWKYTRPDPKTMKEAIKYYIHTPSALVELATTTLGYILVYKR